MSYFRRYRPVLPWGKAYQTFGHQSGGTQIHDRRKRLPQSQDSIEALPLGGVRGALRTVGSGVKRNALMPGGERPRETAHVQTIIEEKRKR